MISDLLREQGQKDMNAVTALVGLAFAAYSLGPWPGGIQYLMSQAGVTEIEAFRGAVILDGFAIYFIWIFLISTAIAILLSIKYLEVERENRGDYYAQLQIGRAHV